MKEEELHMHGSMFFLLRKFIETSYDKNTWDQLTKAAGIEHSNFDVHTNYPASEMFSILHWAKGLTGLSENELKEKFGEHLVPDLMKMYKSYVNPNWKTFEILENTELVMHKAVRREESKASPPVLHVSRVHDKLLIIDYYSKRKMGSLAVGIIRGIAKFYNESERVKIIPNSDPNDERVQIRVEFA